MKRIDLIARINESNDVANKAAAGRILDIIEAALVDGLKTDGEVHLGNGLGTLKKVTRAARTAKVPGTDRSVEVPARQTVVFKASKALKAGMN